MTFHMNLKHSETKIFCAMTAAVLIALSSIAAMANPNAMSLSRKEVNGQIQVTGHYGAAWTEQEIRREADNSCKEVGQRLAGFQLGALSARKGQAFSAVCQ